MPNPPSPRGRQKPRLTRFYWRSAACAAIVEAPVAPRRAAQSKGRASALPVAKARPDARRASRLADQTASRRGNRPIPREIPRPADRKEPISPNLSNSRRHPPSWRPLGYWPIAISLRPPVFRRSTTGPPILAVRVHESAINNTTAGMLAGVTHSSPRMFANGRKTCLENCPSGSRKRKAKSLGRLPLPTRNRWKYIFSMARSRSPFAASSTPAATKPIAR